MAVPFSNTKLRPPQGFRNILEGLSREVLRCQPGDIYAFGTLYFDKLVKIRQDTGYDPAEIGSELEDRFYNKVFKNICGEMAEQDRAALIIQTKYRQYKAKSAVNALRQDRAATKIQAGFQGFLARKKVRRLRQEAGLEMDYARCQAMTDDELEILKEGDRPAIFSTIDDVDDINRVNSFEAPDFSVAEVQQAALTIQAGIMGFVTRQQRREAFADDFDIPSVGDDAIDTPDTGKDSVPSDQALDSTGSKQESGTPAAATAGSSMLDFSDPEVQEAALKIQAGIKGYITRHGDEAGPDRKSLPQSAATAGSSTLDFSDPEVQEAALKIQAGIKGYMTRHGDEAGPDRKSLSQQSPKELDSERKSQSQQVEMRETETSTSEHMLEPPGDQEKLPSQHSAKLEQPEQESPEKKE